MPINKLQYITTNAEDAKKACRGGALWIQLRVKNKPEQEWREIALQTKEVCKKYGAQLIVNDNVPIAKDVQADGVHLGKEDMNPIEARKILGNEFIIGATANTMDDIRRLASQRVDYIGLGPFRFTTTKANISPILGIEGYRYILKQCELENIQTPIVAIGGIQLTDVAEILQTGVYGIAVSSAITTAESIENAAVSFIQAIKNAINYERSA